MGDGPDTAVFRSIHYDSSNSVPFTPNYGENDVKNVRKDVCKEGGKKNKYMCSKEEVGSLSCDCLNIEFIERRHQIAKYTYIILLDILVALCLHK